MKKIVTIILMLLGIAIIFAEDYTLNGLLQEALKKSKDVKIAKIDKEISLNTTVNSILYHFPSLSARVNKTIEPATDHSSSISLNKTLSLNDDLFFDIAKFRGKREIAKLDYSSDLITFTYSFVLAYINILEIQQNYNIQKANVKVRKLNKQRNEVLFQNSEISSLDFQQAKLSLIDAEIALKEQTLMLNEKKNQFFTEYNLLDNGSNFGSFNVEFLDDMPEYQKNNAIKKSNILLTHSKYDHLRSFTNLFPTISVNGSYGYSNSTKDVNFSDALMFKEMEDSKGFSLSASYDLLAIPSRFLNYSNSKKSIKKEKMNFEYLKSTTQNDYNKLVQTYQNDKELLDLYSQKFELSEDKLDLAEEKYRLGMMNLIDLEDAKIEKLNAEIALNNKYHSLLRTHIELYKLLNLDIEF